MAFISRSWPGGFLEEKEEGVNVIGVSGGG